MKVILRNRAQQPEPVSPSVQSPEQPDIYKQPMQQQIQQGEQQDLGILRNIGRLGARAVESAVSLPGQIARAIPEQLLAPIPENPLPNIIKLVQQIPERKTLEEYVSTPVLESVFGKGAAQPQGKLEKNLDAVVKTAVPLMIGGPSNLVARGAHALGIAGAGQLAKWGAKEIGLSKGIQRGLKLGTMVGTSMIGLPSARKFAGALRDKAFKNIPESTLVETQPIRKEFAKIRGQIRKGLQDVPSKEFIQQTINDIEAKFTQHGHSIPAHELFAIRDNYNELYPTLRKKAPKATKYMHDVIESFKKSYESAPKDLVPYFKEYEQAQNIFSAANAYPGLVDFIKKTPKLSTAGGLGALMSALFVSPTKIAVGVGLPALAKGGYDLMGRILSSPGMRNYYTSLTKSLISERPAASIKWATKLYNGLKKKDPNLVQKLESPSITDHKVIVRKRA